jgi:hypothetical protein
VLHLVLTALTALTLPAFIPPAFIPPEFIPPEFIPPEFIPDVAPTRATPPEASAGSFQNIDPQSNTVSAILDTTGQVAEPLGQATVSVYRNPPFPTRSLRPMNDEQLARSIRDAVSRLNEILAETARAGLSVTLRTTSHQTTTTGVEQLVVDVKIHKLL